MRPKLSSSIRSPIDWSARKLCALIGQIDDAFFEGIIPHNGMLCDFMLLAGFKGGLRGAGMEIGSSDFPCSSYMATAS